MFPKKFYIDKAIEYLNKIHDLDTDFVNHINIIKKNIYLEHITIEILPYDCYTIIFSYLDSYKDIFAFRKCSKLCNNIVVNTTILNMFDINKQHTIQIINGKTVLISLYGIKISKLQYIDKEGQYYYREAHYLYKKITNTSIKCKEFKLTEHADYISIINIEFSDIAIIEMLHRLTEQSYFNDVDIFKNIINTKFIFIYPNIYDMFTAVKSCNKMKDIANFYIYTHVQIGNLSVVLIYEGYKCYSFQDVLIYISDNKS